MKEALIGLFLGAIIAFALLILVGHAEAQNCPQDWHPPPCGIPPKPMKTIQQQAVEELERYHWKATQVWGLWIAATCPGSTGVPSVDAARRSGCMVGSFAGGVTLIMQQWESRVLSEMRDTARNMQFVVLAPQQFTALAGDMDTGGNPYLAALADHGDAIESLGNLIVQSVIQTLACDEWAETNVEGIFCGNDQRAWTQYLFSLMSERYHAVADTIEALTWPLIADIGQGVNEEMVNDLFDEAAWDRWGGREFPMTDYIPWIALAIGIGALMRGLRFLILAALGKAESA